MINKAALKHMTRTGATKKQTGLDPKLLSIYTLSTCCNYSGCPTFQHTPPQNGAPTALQCSCDPAAQQNAFPAFLRKTMQQL